MILPLTISDTKYRIMHWTPRFFRYRTVSDYIGYDRFNQSDLVGVAVLIRSELNKSGRRIFKEKTVNHLIGVESNRSDPISELNRIVHPSDGFRSALFNLGNSGILSRFNCEKVGLLTFRMAAHVKKFVRLTKF